MLQRPPLLLGGGWPGWGENSPAAFRRGLRVLGDCGVTEDGPAEETGPFITRAVRCRLSHRPALRTRPEGHEPAGKETRL